jgi:hypothetical protein
MTLLIVTMSLKNALRYASGRKIVGEGCRQMDSYEIRPRNDHRAVDVIFNVLPFGRLW